MTETNDVVAWLLMSSIPTIRYRALTHLLGRSEGDPDVRAAREALMTEGPIPALLARQTERGQWGTKPNYYSPKYRSTHWTMLLLEELGVDGRDDRFRQGADFMLSAVGETMARRADRGEYGWSCLFGNVLRYAIRAGYLDDPRTQAILRYVEVDLGRGHCACAYNYGLACGWGVARSLWGAAVVPEPARSPTLQAAIDRGISFMLEEFALEQANYPTGDGKVHPLWYRLNFPLFYQADILFALRALADAGALGNAGAQPALDWLSTKRGSNGRWRGSNPFRQRTWAAIGQGEETDRWVSLQSATVLRQAGRLN